MELFTVLTVAVVVVAVVGWKPLRKWLKGGRCHSNARMDGKTVIITGCNTGIGKETAKDLAKRGARVIMACRNMEKAKAAQLDIIRESGSSNVVVKRLDLASMKSIREFADEIKSEEESLHALLNNAAIAVCPPSKTEDGFEMQFGTNHLGHFLLTLLLLDLLKTSAPSRIINVSSLAYLRGKINFDDIMLTKNYDNFGAYSQSKLANILFTSELARRLKGTGVTCYSLHPGPVETDILRHRDTYNAVWTIVLFFSEPFFKTAEEGAQTSIHCCVDKKAGQETGLYYSDCTVKQLKSHARDDKAARELWDLSLKLVGLEE